MPLAATEPKRTTPAPPSTGRGTTAISEAATGHRPMRTRKPPPVATTKRLRILVIATSPMFWANALHMKPLNSGAIAEPRVSARSPAAMVLSSAGRSTISPRASMSAVDSVIDTTITTHSERIAASWNCGAPKWNGVGEADEVRLGDRGEVGDAERHGDQGAGDQAEQHGDLLDEAAGEAAQQQHDEQGDGGEAQVGGGAVVVRVGARALRPAEGDGQQGDADQGDHGAGDHGREEADRLAEEGRGEEAEQPGDDDRAEDDGQGVLLVVGGGDDRGHGGDAGEGDAVDERQPGADLPHADGLEERGEAEAVNRQAPVRKVSSAG